MADRHPHRLGAARWRHLLARRPPTRGLHRGSPRGDDLVRDLHHADPAYLHADDVVAGGSYLPTSVLLETLPFLAAIRGLASAAADRAHHVATAVMGASVEVLTVTTADPNRLVEICDRLVPGRVNARILDGVAGATQAGGRP
ncbi:hypothetical protein [Phytohabitans houttuyneae]|uniref:hypothetical protein n=1 Tax=Phytohabitans houttuyneae TaxID=1076126 RepID=UPI001566E83C|nr:hypothetical protein [Phytohabitans houttuyneae]